MMTTMGWAMTVLAIHSQRDRREAAACSLDGRPSARRMRSIRPVTDSELTLGPRMPSSAGRKVMA